jgi:polysaccharide pyruvyl transferase WcaK-like protein
MTIQVLGWYNHGNTGDEAYKVAFPSLFEGHDVEFVEVLDPNNPPDCVVLGGGDVFYPSFTRHVASMPSHVRKIAASISLTENSDFASLGLFEKVIVRDHRSALIASQRGHSVQYQPDFTFLLQPDGQAGRAYLDDAVRREGHRLYERVVVCVISNYLANTKLDMLARDLTAFLKLSQDLALVADETPASFVFLPFSTKAPWDDRVSNSWVADRCKYYDKNLVVWDRLDVQTTLNVIAAADAVVSSRLHSTIFSTIAGIPFIDLTHHTKNLGFLETVEKTEWSIPFWEFSVTHYGDLLNRALKAPKPEPSLKQFADSAKARLRDMPLL